MLARSLASRKPIVKINKEYDLGEIAKAAAADSEKK
jgi:hypothetical protein